MLLQVATCKQEQICAVNKCMPGRLLAQHHTVGAHLLNFSAGGKGSPATLRGKLPFALYTPVAARTTMALGALGRGGKAPLQVHRHLST